MSANDLENFANELRSSANGLTSDAEAATTATNAATNELAGLPDHWGGPLADREIGAASSLWSDASTMVGHIDAIAGSMRTLANRADSIAASIRSIENEATDPPADATMWERQQYRDAADNNVALKMQEWESACRTFDMEVVEPVGALYATAPADGDGGPSFPHLHQGEGSPWVAQGFGRDDDIGTYFTTYYHEDDDDGQGIRLSVQDGYGELSDVQLMGLPGSDDLPTKGGGVDVYNGRVYVADTSEVYVYDLNDIYDAGPGEQISANNVIKVESGSASYINIENGQAYVGRWVENRPDDDPADGVPEMHVYDIDKDNGTFSDPVDTVATPYNTQGVAVNDDGVVFSTSVGSGDNSVSELVSQKWADRQDFALDPDRHVTDVPFYGEGVQIAGNEVLVAFEGGADKYQGDEGVNQATGYDIDEVMGD